MPSIFLYDFQLSTFSVSTLKYFFALGYWCWVQQCISFIIYAHNYLVDKSHYLVVEILFCAEFNISEWCHHHHHHHQFLYKVFVWMCSGFPNPKNWRNWKKLNCPSPWGGWLSKHQISNDQEGFLRFRSDW